MGHQSQAPQPKLAGGILFASKPEVVTGTTLKSGAQYRDSRKLDVGLARVFNRSFSTWGVPVLGSVHEGSCYFVPILGAPIVCKLPDGVSRRCFYGAFAPRKTSMTSARHVDGGQAERVEAQDEEPGFTRRLAVKGLYSATILRILIMDVYKYIYIYLRFRHTHKCIYIYIYRLYTYRQILGCLDPDS